MSHDRGDVEDADGGWALLVRTSHVCVVVPQSIGVPGIEPSVGLFQYRWVTIQGC